MRRSSDTWLKRKPSQTVHSFRPAWRKGWKGKVTNCLPREEMHVCYAARGTSSRHVKWISTLRPWPHLSCLPHPSVQRPSVLALDAVPCVRLESASGKVRVLLLPILPGVHAASVLCEHADRKPSSVRLFLTIHLAACHRRLHTGEDGRHHRLLLVRSLQLQLGEVVIHLGIHTRNERADTFVSSLSLVAVCAAIVGRIYEAPQF